MERQGRGAHARLCAIAVVCLAAGCGSPRDRGASGGDGGVVRGDGGGARDGSIPTTDGGTGGDGSAPVDGGGAPDGGPSCDPPSGGEPVSAYCDLFELAIFESPGAPAEARLFGRVSAGEGCAVVDEVEVQYGGVAIATLDGAGPFESGDQYAALARGPATPEMTSRCADDTNRFGGFGLIVRGRSSDGPFEAHCADAEGGGRWPPALRVTCHDNVDRQPFHAYASVTSSSGFSWTTLDISVPHGPGGALLTADGALRIIPHSDPIFGGPPAPPPFDSSGWSATISESTAPLPGTYSSVSFSVDEAAFDTTLCPPPMTEPPGPDYVPPPVFLVRFTGTGERGAYSTEAYVDMCNTL